VTAYALLKKAAQAGVVLRLEGGTLRVRGCREAVGVLAPELRAHKADIVALLASEASNDPDPPVTEPAPATRQSHQEWVQTWQPLADAYHAHHFACAVCVAAGKGFGLRCGAGAALWLTYTEYPSGDHPGSAPTQPTQGNL
jgi:hypothetical protein